MFIRRSIKKVDIYYKGKRITTGKDKDKDKDKGKGKGKGKAK
jgi:hypothetical protein